MTIYKENQTVLGVAKLDCEEFVTYRICSVENQIMILSLEIFFNMEDAY